MMRFTKALSAAFLLGCLAFAANIANADIIADDGTWYQKLQRFDNNGQSLGTLSDDVLEASNGMTTGPDGNYYIASGAGVQRYNVVSNKMETFVSSTGSHLSGPEDVAFGADGDLYVSSNNDGHIYRFAGPSAANPGQLVGGTYWGNTGGVGPSGMEWHNGVLYVAHSGWNVVKTFDTTGAQIADFVTVPGNGGLSGAMGLTFGSDGDLYVASNSNGKILRYNGTTGAYIGAFATASNFMPFDIAFNGGYLYASNQVGGNILRFDATTGVQDASWSAILPSGGSARGFVFTQAAPVPEPSSACALFMGLGALVALRRRRK